MKKIDEMIKQLCPNGVEYKPIGDIMYVSDYVSAGSFASIRENVQYLSEPNYAILLRFADFSSGFDPEKFVYVNEKAYNYLNKSNLQPGDIVMSNVGSCGLLFACPDLGKPMTLAPNSIVIKTLNNRFYFHWLSSKVAQNEIEKIKSKSAMPKFNKTDFKKILAPIPPLSIQEEIVSVLDKFSELIEKTDEEIALRQKQYEYYREKLLTFEDGEVEWKPIKEISTKICSGGTPSRSKNEYFTGNIPWLRTQEVNWGDVYDTDIKITEEAVRNSSAKLIPANCVIIAMYGATAGKSCINKIPLTTNQACCNIEVDSSKVDYKYLFFFVCKEYENLKAMGEGSQNNINGQKIKDYKIPTPSPSRQQKIVDTLDKFEALISKLKEERELRQKQYEYYREKLLTF